MFKKLKSWLADDSIYMASLLVLIGVTSFGLGRLSVAVPERAASEATVVLSNPREKSLDTVPEVASTTAGGAEPEVPIDPKTAPFVASKAGSKFHKVTCPGAKQIKTENKIFFNSIEEAKASGYTPAANCPGL